MARSASNPADIKHSYHLWPSSPSNPHLQHCPNNIHFLPPPLRLTQAHLTLPRLCCRVLPCLYVHECIPKMPRNHLRGLDALKEPWGGALRGVHVW